MNIPENAGDCQKYPDLLPWEKTIAQRLEDGENPIIVYSEKDPNGLDSKTPGAKLDAGKSPVMQGCLQYFPRALLEVAKVSLKGAKKYSWKGWEHVVDGPTRYGNALSRHILAEAIEGPYDSDTKELHAAQVAWNALARLELILRESESNHGKS